ncbi:MAG: nuclear transport factor 2 family protein [Allosphingosinicella sp.]
MRFHRLGAFALLLIAAPATVAVPPAPTAAASAAREAEAAVDGFHAALGRGDVKAALAFLADDALIYEEGRAERSKAEYGRLHVEADAAFSKAVNAEIVKRMAGTIAWIATEGRLRGTYHGRDVNRVTAETMVLRRTGAEWKIVHIHWSSAMSSSVE